MNGIFTEEVIKSFCDTGKISVSATPDEARDIILLSMENTIRFNGIVKHQWSILQHSWMVGILAADYALTAMEDEKGQACARIAGMMHDMGEVIVGDVVWPLKSGCFEKGYDELYRPLEKAFCKWAAGYVFGVDAFEEKYRMASKYVEKADEFMGTLEMFGVSKIADYGFSKYANVIFENVLPPSRERFRETIKQMKEILQDVKK